MAQECTIWFNPSELHCLICFDYVEDLIDTIQAVWRRAVPSQYEKLLQCLSTKHTETKKEKGKQMAKEKQKEKEESEEDEEDDDEEDEPEKEKEREREREREKEKEKEKEREKEKNKNKCMAEGKGASLPEQNFYRHLYELKDIVQKTQKQLTDATKCANANWIKLPRAIPKSYSSSSSNKLDFLHDCKNAIGNAETLASYKKAYADKTKKSWKIRTYNQLLDTCYGRQMENACLALYEDMIKQKLVRSPPFLLEDVLLDTNSQLKFSWGLKGRVDAVFAQPELTVVENKARTVQLTNEVSVREWLQVQAYMILLDCQRSIVLETVWNSVLSSSSCLNVYLKAYEVKRDRKNWSTYVAPLLARYAFFIYQLIHAKQQDQLTYLNKTNQERYAIVYKFLFEQRKP